MRQRRPRVPDPRASRRRRWPARAQRIRLATQIGASLVGVLYILDEPSHRAAPARQPAPYRHAHVPARTSATRLSSSSTTSRRCAPPTGSSISAPARGPTEATWSPKPARRRYEEQEERHRPIPLRRSTIPIPADRRKGNGGSIVIRGAASTTSRASISSSRLGLFACITGVSGSGKSTLLTDLLYPVHLERSYGHRLAAPGELRRRSWDSRTSTRSSTSTRAPIGRTPRSNPATYVGAFTAIRDLFASLPESKARGWKPGRFSFNVKGRALRDLPRRRHDQDRDALPARRLHHLRRVPRPPLQFATPSTSGTKARTSPTSST